MSRKIALNPAVLKPFASVDPRMTDIVNSVTLSPEFVRLLNEIISNRRISAGAAQPITIAAGAITLSQNFSYFVLDTESAAASDDLDTINGGNVGDIIFIEAANAARTVVIKDGTGNIKTNGSVDLSLDNSDDLAMLFYTGTSWKADIWNVSA